jgi:ABC-type antimicrobial peptide transport system permease subunit
LLQTDVADANALAKPLVRLVRTLDPDQPLDHVLTLDHLFSAKLGRERLIVSMMAVFAGLTLVLAAVGVHGVLSYAVTLRTQEIGVRRALGGSERAILGLVMRRWALLLGLGVATGLPVAIAIRWYLATEWVGSGDYDPTASTVALAVGAGAGLVASMSSARRAMQVDPMTALRCE